MKMSLSPFIFNMILEARLNAIKLDNEIKGIHIGKEHIKLLLFADEMIIYIAFPKELRGKIFWNQQGIIASLHNTRS